MYAAIKVCNYDIAETTMVMFTTKQLAIEYLEKWWQDEYNTALAKSESKLYESETYHEDEYAQINWEDGAKIEFYVVKDSRPQEWR